MWWLFLLVYLQTFTQHTITYLSSWAKGRARYTALINCNKSSNLGTKAFKRGQVLTIYLFAAFVPTVGRLLLNPLYISTVLGSCTSVYYLSGWISFLPKYFQVQFNYSASDSSMYAGGFCVYVLGHNIYKQIQGDIYNFSLNLACII